MLLLLLLLRLLLYVVVVVELLLLLLVVLLSVVVVVDVVVNGDVDVALETAHDIYETPRLGRISSIFWGAMVTHLEP